MVGAVIVADHGVVNMVAVVVGVAEACSHTWKTCLCVCALLETHTQTHLLTLYNTTMYLLVRLLVALIARLLDWLMGWLAGWPAGWGRAG